MNNPWQHLPEAAPFVLDDDRAQIDCFNTSNTASPELQIQTQLLPEPYIGDPAAPVYALCLNPGYSPNDEPWHRNAAFVNAIRQSHTHALRERPHYYLDPDFSECPGSRWWHRKCRWLIDDCGIDALSHNLFCAELFPYHSHKYKRFPRSLSQNGLLSSSRYTAHLIDNAIRDVKLIVQMRSAKQWMSLVPDLVTYDRVVRLNSPQNVALSPKNLDRYSDVASAIQGGR